ncbi:CYLD hydrolase, partial [Amia calva]|nr:CYLD hydrolase [Amia calva]
MDRTGPGQKYFIVTKGKVKPGKKGISKGCIGYVETETKEEVIGPVFTSGVKGSVKLEKENLHMLSKHQAQLLLFVSPSSKRLEVLQKEELFRAICCLVQSDVVVVQHKKESKPGVVQGVIQIVRKESYGDVTMLGFDVEITVGTNRVDSPLLAGNKQEVAYVLFSLCCLALNMKDVLGNNSDPNLVQRGQDSRNSQISRGSGPPRMLRSTLEVGSMVEFKAINLATLYGVVRWIGVPEGKNQPWAGVELDYEVKGCTDGKLGVHRYFTCNGNKAMFVVLKNCKPDSRFLPLPPYKEAPQYHELQSDGSFEEDTDVPPIPESKVLALLEGRMKGIQGHYNSCYLDASLLYVSYSLFSCCVALDSVLHSSAGSEKHIQKILRRDIVNRLRRQGFVPAGNVMNLRKLLGCDTYLTEEKDPEEFISILLNQVLSVDPLLKIRSNGKTQDSYTFQIILEKEQVVSTPTVQQLLETSFLTCDLKFQEIPSCLIIQMPRFGKKYKMFPQIIPSTELDITDLLHNTPRECFVCGGLAAVECYACVSDRRLMPGRIKQYCRPCEKQVHSHRLRRDHRPRELTLPHSFSSADPVPRQKLELFAVLCIETSHYVSFVKYGPGKHSWLFFDSMADRCGGENGYNIPEIRACPQVGDFLSQSEDDLAKADPCNMDESVKRLLCDSYMCMYQCPALSLYR